LPACLAISNFKRSFRGPCRAHPAALLPKCERLQIARSQKQLACQAVAQPHLPMALLAQRHRDWGCLLVLPPQTSNVSLGVRAGRLRQPCSQNANVCRQLASIKASLKSSCSASSAHGTARTEAKRLALLACLATSNFKRIFGGPCRKFPAALIPKCECLQIARRQKGIACKAAAQPHLPIALLAQAQRLGLIACLATSNFKSNFKISC